LKAVLCVLSCEESAKNDRLPIVCVTRPALPAYPEPLWCRGRLLLPGGGVMATYAEPNCDRSVLTLLIKRLPPPNEPLPALCVIDPPAPLLPPNMDDFVGRAACWLPQAY
jgi:hypothetical protein